MQLLLQDWRTAAERDELWRFLLCKLDTTRHKSLPRPFITWKEACLAWGAKPTDWKYSHDQWYLTRREMPSLFKPLVRHLKQISGTSDDFVCSGDVAESNPQVYFPELDTFLEYPCQSEQLKTLISKLAKPAMFGRRNEVG